MAISTKPAISRNPAQPRPIALPEQRDRMLGRGTLRTAASLTGPARQTPRFNLAAQSARSTEAAQAPATSGQGDNARTIARESVELPSPYGPGLGTRVP